MASGTSAGFGRRFAALLYDVLLLSALLVIYTGVLMACTRRAILEGNYPVGIYAYRAGLLAVIGGYYTLNWMRSGQTLGMRAWRLRAVSDTGHPMGGTAAVLRYMCGILAWPPAALGVLWLYVDAEHLAIHDRLSHTRVVLLAKG